MAAASKIPSLKGPLRGLTKGEILDAAAASRAGRALDPLAQLLRRGSDLAVGQESTRVLTEAFSFVRSEEVDGDYAEFGVWMGRTFVEAWRIAGGISDERRRRFFAFDSFAGLPEVDGVDDTGRFAEGDFSFARQAFEARLRRARVPAEDVHIVEGFYDDSLADPARIPLEKVAIAWVDCDLYSSTVPVLDYLTPRLADGAIILFDDWFCFRGDPTKGEQRACAEWLERNPGISLVPWRQFRWAGQAFIVRRDDLAPDDAAAQS